MKKSFIILSSTFIILLASLCNAQLTQPYNGLNMNLGTLPLLSNAQTRSISAENFTGEKGRGGMAKLTDSVYFNKAISANSARELGQGWKLNPAIFIKAHETFTLANIDGPGAIQHIWFTPGGNWRLFILRMYWDDETQPSVECPVGDFFGVGWGSYAQINSLPVAVNPGSGLNCYWLMPFRKKCRITFENMDSTDMVLFFQIDYTLTQVPADMGYFHAQFRRSNPNTTSIHTLVDNIKGKGQYVGTYIAWGINNPGWWGEGEMKFYMDGDKEFPTICGTGTEDYFLGSYGFEINNKPVVYTTPYVGVPQIIEPDSSAGRLYRRFGMYRWHINEPIRFQKDLKVTMQDLGWKFWGLYLAQKSDISSVAYWYQTEPHNPFPKFYSREELIIK
ncbi:MAG: glycoside hydrolase family 172 protein [Parafilimonas sp.]